MPVPAATRALVQAMLPPGEEIQYVVPAMITSGSVLVVVTSWGINVLSTSRTVPSWPRSVLARFPRQTRLGPPDLYGTPSFTLGGVRYEVDDEYLAVINAVDVEGAGGDVLPPDPFPDL